MKTGLRLIFVLALTCLLIVPTFGYNTAVKYSAETAPPHVITLDANGGRVDPEQIILQNDGVAGTLPTPSRSGYKFLGWYTDMTFETEFTEDTFVDRNVTIYAKWKGRGGGGYVPPQSDDSGGTVESAETFDAGIAMYGAMTLLSTAAGAALVMNQKKHAD